MAAKPRILTMDRNRRNLELLGQFLGKEGYETLPVSTMEEFDSIIESSEDIAIALIDISGFDRSIWQACEQLAGNGVQLLVISPQQLSGIRQQSTTHGAQGVLFKPLAVKALMQILHSMIPDTLDE
jgi:CheY-like chemotaxis protein